MSLDPYSNQVTRHQMPDQDSADPFGLAPDDDVIGYTESDPGHNKVGVMFPKGDAVCITPTTQYNVPHETVYITPTSDDSLVTTGTVFPVGKTVLGQFTPKADGTFIEAMIDTCKAGDDPSKCDSQIPLGITPIKGKAEGTFFYAVGQNASTAKSPDGTVVPANRVGFVRFPMREKIKHPRDDDDENDGDDSAHDWHDWHGHADGNDDDDDGLDNSHDQHAWNEKDSRADDPNDGGSVVLNGGTSTDYQMVASRRPLRSLP